MHPFNRGYFDHGFTNPCRRNFVFQLNIISSLSVALSVSPLLGTLDFLVSGKGRTSFGSREEFALRQEWIRSPIKRRVKGPPCGDDPGSKDCRVGEFSSFRSTDPG